MKDRREINIEVFEDTMKHYKSNPTLKAAVSNSVANQKFTAADETVELPQCAGYTPTVTVSGKRSLEAAVEYTKQGMKTCVLNFASASNPGGGVTLGASAQEESICRARRCTPALTQVICGAVSTLRTDKLKIRSTTTIASTPPMYM